jgi:hypothetical protein
MFFKDRPYNNPVLTRELKPSNGTLKIQLFSKGDQLINLLTSNLPKFEMDRGFE